jgi:hypothetical protein
MINLRTGVIPLHILWGFPACSKGNFTFTLDVTIFSGTLTLQKFQNFIIDTEGYKKDSRRMNIKHETQTNETTKTSTSVTNHNHDKMQQHNLQR